MKTVLIIIFTCLISSNCAYCQFYTVSKKKNYIEIQSTNTANRKENQSTPTIPSNNRENNTSCKTAQKDSTYESKPKINLLSLPLDSIYITSKFGKRTDPFSKKKKIHHGIDLRTHSSEVYSIMPGKIKKIGYEKKGLGNYIKISHGEFEVTYGHLHTVLGEEGDFIEAGERVGISGNTGKSTGEHLHLAIKFKGKYVDPFPILNYLKGAL